MQYFHRLVDRLQARGAAAAVGMVLADQLPVAQLDGGIVDRAFQLEQGEGGGLLLAALHARPETLQQPLDVGLAGLPQVTQVEVVVAQRIALFQRADLQVRLALGPEVVAQVVERVEQEEMGAEQHQLVGQFAMGDMRRMAGLQQLDQLVFGKPLGMLAQQAEDLPGEVEAVVEVGSHGARLASGVGRGWGRRRFVRRSAEPFGVLVITGQR